MNDLLNFLLKDSFTLSQLKNRLRILRSALSVKFYNGQQLDRIPIEDSTWFNSLPESFLQSFNKDNLSEIIEELETQINKLEVLTIFLPFDTTDEGLTQIGIHTRNTFGKVLLLDIKYNPLLIAGCAMSWKGIYKDYSLHSKIQERKQTIIENFKKFLT